MSEHSAMTFRELKAELDKLSEQQLDKPVLWFGEERGGKIARVEVMTEAHGDPSGEGMEALSTYRDEHETEEEWAEFLDRETSLEAGDPTLVSDEKVGL